MSEGSHKVRPYPLSDPVEATADTAEHCSIDEMQAACHAEGWSIEIRQLEAGTMNARMASRECADITLLDQFVSRRVELVGEAPEGYVSVLAPLGQGRFAINGQSFDGPGLFLLESRTELEAVNNEVLRVIGMTVPTSLLRETGRNISHTWEARDRCRTMLIQHGEPCVQRFRALIRATIHQRLSDLSQVERASALATGLATIIDRHSASPKTTSRTTSAESLRIVRRAREFIEEHLSGAAHLFEQIVTSQRAAKHIV